MERAAKAIPAEDADGADQTAGAHAAGNGNAVFQAEDAGSNRTGNSGGQGRRQPEKNASGTCYMDPRDMGKLGVKNWDTVLVKTEWGEVVVNAAVSRDAPHEGTVFICKGPWANTVVSPDTYCCSDPTYKGIHCTVEKTDREVLLMADLMRWVYKKYVDSDDDDVVEHMESLGERPVYKGRKWEELIDHDI